MRLVLVVVSVTLLSLPAAARPRKRAHPRAQPAPAVHVVPNDRAATEHARAEAELSDLRAGRVSDDAAAAPDMPAQAWAVQENDREVPANLRQKK